MESKGRGCTLLTLKREEEEIGEGQRMHGGAGLGAGWTFGLAAW